MNLELSSLNKMDNKTRTDILEDYGSVNKTIKESLAKGSNRPNFFVVREHYIAPTIYSEQLPLTDERGELQYFIQIRNCLEGILINEKAPFKILHAPNYIEQFFE